jgi:hypothetical protein
MIVPGVSVHELLPRVAGVGADNAILSLAYDVAAHELYYTVNTTIMAVRGAPPPSPSQYSAAHALTSVLSNTSIHTQSGAHSITRATSTLTNAHPHTHAQLPLSHDGTKSTGPARVVIDFAPRGVQSLVVEWNGVGGVGNAGGGGAPDAFFCLFDNVNRSSGSLVRAPLASLAKQTILVNQTLPVRTTSPFLVHALIPFCGLPPPPPPPHTHTHTHHHRRRRRHHHHHHHHHILLCFSTS